MLKEEQSLPDPYQNQFANNKLTFQLQEKTLKLRSSNVLTGKVYQKTYLYEDLNDKIKHYFDSLEQLFNQLLFALKARKNISVDDSGLIKLKIMVNRKEKAVELNLNQVKSPQISQKENTHSTVQVGKLQRQINSLKNSFKKLSSEVSQNVKKEIRKQLKALEDRNKFKKRASYSLESNSQQNEKRSSSTCKTKKTLKRSRMEQISMIRNYHMQQLSKTLPPTKEESSENTPPVLFKSETCCQRADQMIKVIRKEGIIIEKLAPRPFPTKRPRGAGHCFLQINELSLLTQNFSTKVKVMQAKRESGGKLIKCLLGDETGVIEAFLPQMPLLYDHNTVVLTRAKMEIFRGLLQIKVEKPSNIGQMFGGIDYVDENNNISYQSCFGPATKRERVRTIRYKDRNE